MMQAFVQSVGVLGPGLPGWTMSRSILRGLAPYHFEATPRPIPDILPTTERRRSSEAIRLAVAVAQEAMDASDLVAQSVATVFASSEGDGDITHKLCQALASPERQVSPTLFHNSVYNAPAGYWSISTGSRFASTSLCAYDASFAAGLLEAAGQVMVEQQAVLLIAFDLPFPAPLHAIRPVEQSFAVALLLTPTRRANSLMQWDIRLEQGRMPSPLPAMVPECLQGNPAMRCLPLLEALARETAQTVELEYVNGSDLIIRCEP